MAKRIITEEIRLGIPSVRPLIRSTLWRDVEQMAAGSFQIARTVNWFCSINKDDTISVSKGWQIEGERILKIRYFLMFDVFVDFAGDYEVVMDKDKMYELDDFDNKKIAEDVDKGTHEFWVTFKHEAKFVMWLMENADKLNGMKREDAVKLLKENQHRP